MKADYKNWMPKGMVLGTAAGAGIALILYIVFGLAPVLQTGTLKTVLGIVFLVLTIILILVTVWMFLMYRAFSYNGKRQMSRQIIEGIAAYVNIPDGGKSLDGFCIHGDLESGGRCDRYRQLSHGCQKHDN